jgi:CubicO group peptidase (beta-lactamase class C family)
MKKLLILLGLMLASASAATADDRRDALLADGSGYTLALPFDAFARPDDAPLPETPISGRVTLDMTALSGGFQLVRDAYGTAENPEYAVRTLPEISIGLMQDEDDIIPSEQGLIETAHPYFDLIFTSGKVWMEGERRFLSLPFALMEKNANCIHNGVLLVALGEDGKASNALAQVGSETCAYFQFNFWSAYSADWQAGDAEVARQAHGKLPLKSVADLPETIDTKALSQESLISPADMTTYGLVLDGIHYSGGCMTRLGAYPHCESMVLPSYSLAKSLAGGLGLMALENRLPGMVDRKVADLVLACADWGNVTLGHLLNMTTGRYKSRIAHADEASEGYIPFFTASTGAEKTAFSCSYFDSKAKPGKRWVYHTSDTYLLGVVMNAALSGDTPGADYYRDHLLPVWQEMGLSPLLSVMRRTGEPDASPFTGYGMAFTADDIARLASALTSGNTPFEGRMLDSALQRNPADRGLEAGNKTLRYKNGFWAWNAREPLGCSTDTWLPFLSGFGGITVVLLPGGNVYYYFSDGGVHAFADAIKAISAVTPICGEMP